jgi:type IV pilus assembly protein PilA
MLQFFAKRLNEMQEVRRDERGFTLIELLVVVIIIGILAAIAIPVFLNQREKAQIATVKSDVRNAVTMDTAMKSDGGGGIPAGTYTEGQNVGDSANTFRVSKGVTITVDASTIKGAYDGVAGAWTYSKTAGTYTGSGNY